MRNPYEILKSVYGYSEFRDGQREIIESIIDGKDVIALMPTGGGKSICYQVPAIARAGCAVVVSPLISLMKDQVDTLRQNGVEAAYINSSLSQDDLSRVVRNLVSGKYKLIYVAPERLVLPSFIDILCAMKVSFFAVDEAHCVSQWGHDFRPSYVKINDVLDEVASRVGRRIQRVALTATATVEVKNDVISLLGLKDYEQYLKGFDRPNLRFIVNSSFRKLDDVSHEIGLRKGLPIIVYCGSRKNVESVTRLLRADGHAAVGYHAGLNPAERTKVQEDFIYDRANIIVATNAFGMGIDKPNVRLVIHYDMPGSLEAYYQEAGRAGRDGEPADCILLYSAGDRKLQQFLIDANYPSEESVKAVRDLFVAWSEDFIQLTHDQIADYLGPVKKYMVGSILSILESQGIIESASFQDDSGDGFSSGWFVKDRYKTPDMSAVRLRRRVAENNLSVMEGFCRTKRCRRQAVLRYFGDRSAPSYCGGCDVCLGQTSRHGGVNGNEVVRMILLAVRDAPCHVKPDVLAKILMGSRDSVVSLYGLDRLSSFSSLKQWTMPQILRSIEYLSSEDFICVSKDDGCIYLNDASDDVINGKGSVVMPDEIMLPKSPDDFSSFQNKSSIIKRVDIAAALDDLRRELSEESQVPPFMIWGQRTARELANVKPTTIEGLSRVFGMGEEKVNRFGERVLSLLKEAV